LKAELRFAVPGDIKTLTGGYAYDRRLMQELRRAHWNVQHLALPAGFPFPDAGDLAASARQLAHCPTGSLVLVDGLAYGALGNIVEKESERLRMVALIHHALADETGLDRLTRERLFRLEQQSLAAARGIIATSDTTAKRLIEDYAVPPSRLAVARPGSDRQPPTKASGGAFREGLNLVSVGTLTKRKGHDLLVEALARLSHLSWQCNIVGSLDRSPETASDIRRRIGRHGLQSRIALLGEVSDISAIYAHGDVFVLPSRHEGYGMVFAEAMQHGLPVIATTAGAIPEVVPDAAGILVPPDNVSALANAMERLMRNPAERRRLASGARVAARLLPTWRDTADHVAKALRHFAALPPPAGLP
jgi:glycosyltransferase involved in cell wall biosynthesis